MMNWRGRWAILFLLCAGSAQADELAQLSNGMSFYCERHEQLGDFTRLYLDGSNVSFIDVATVEIASYELVFAPVPELPAPAPQNISSLSEHIARASRATGIDRDFIESVIKAESGYDSNAVSPKGAMGLMQLMPSTAEKLGVRNPLDPAANIDGGSRYLRELLLRFGGDAIKALAAYNAGPERVEKYKGVPPYPETRDYVKRVIDDFNRRKQSAKQEQNVADAGTKSGNTSQRQFEP